MNLATQETVTVESHSYHWNENQGGSLTRYNVTTREESTMPIEA